MKTRLEARFSLKTVAIAGELAVEQKRPDLALLCQTAAGEGLTRETVTRVAPTLDVGGAERILAQCRHLGLIDPAGGLTDAGHRCAREGTALLPEFGMYGLLVGEHPCVGRQVFSFDRLPGAMDDRRTDDLVPAADHIAVDAVEGRQTDVLHADRAFAIRRLQGAPGERPLCRVVDGVGEARFEWMLDLSTGENTRRISLGPPPNWAPESKNDPRRATGAITRTLPPADGALLRGLFSRWEPRWSDEFGFVRLEDDGTPIRTPFVRTFQFASVSVPGYGTFQNVEITDVPVGPENETVAEAWARRLHRERLFGAHGYLADAAVSTLFDEVVADTPLSRFAPTRPDLNTLIDSLAAESRPAARKTAARLAAVRDVTWHR
jgi:hypothetical protein